MLGSPPGSRLGPENREQALAALSSAPLDMLVVGGGVTGAGIALDAVTRGLSVGVVERDDFASGTSSRSSKLIHGGLRYLEQRNFALVGEALHERRLLLTQIAPHLVRPVPSLLPLRRHWERGYFGAGLALYDGLSGLHPDVPRHRHLGRRATLEAAPGLRGEALVGGIRYFYAQIDDARFALMLLRTAAGHGAWAASRLEVIGFLGRKRIEGARLRDSETGRELDIRARVTVLASGVWAGALESLAGVAEPISIRPSKGVHLLVPRDRIELGTALIVRAGGSVLLTIPWGSHWLIGTTDTPWDLDQGYPTATLADIDYLLGALNRVLRRPLTRGDVTGVFAGLRPLVGSNGAETTRISREHVVRQPREGLVTVTGGKFTTYRVMAADGVDASGREFDVQLDPSRTETVPLIGAEGLGAARAELGRGQLAEDLADRLLERYGALATEVTADVERIPALAHSIPGAEPYIAAEVIYAVTHEGARHVEDVLARRTRISIESPDHGYQAASIVADLMAPLLGWSRERVDAEVVAYRRQLDADYAAQAAA